MLECFVQYEYGVNSMFKSLKAQLTLSLLVAGAFIYQSLSYVEFTGEFRFNQVLIYLIMVVSVYNAGLITQRYVEARKKKKL
jgi:CDP-diglyceride synthetase